MVGVVWGPQSSLVPMSYKRRGSGEAAIVTEHGKTSNHKLKSISQGQKEMALVYAIISSTLG